MFKWGVHSFIWSENFVKEDLWVIEKAKSLGFKVLDIGIFDTEKFPAKEVAKTAKSLGLEVITTEVLRKEANLIDPDKNIRKNGIEFMKKVIDVNIEIGSKLTAGINHAAAGYLTGKPRTKDEWNWSVESMQEIGSYARSVSSDLVIAVECVNRFETHFLNIAEDAVRYCKDVGTGNIKVHIDAYHMIREEKSFREAVEVCGKEYLGLVHVCESNRGIPGTGLVPWVEFLTALKSINYEGPLVIEAFDPSFEELNRITATWRTYAKTGEELAIKGLENLKKFEANL